MTLQDASAFVMGISGLISKAVVLIFVYELGIYRDDIIEFVRNRMKKDDD